MQVLFGRKRTKPVISPYFAEELLDLEAELDMSPKLPVVKRLIELYSRAVEFYSPSQDPKYLHYQERLHSLLGRDDVLKLLEGPLPKSGRQEKRSQSSQHTRPVDLSNELNAERTLQTHNLCSNQVSSLLKANFQSQQRYLSHRLIKRKAEKGKFENQQSCFATEVETVMEKYCEEKARVRGVLEERLRQELVAAKEIGNLELEMKITEEIKKRVGEELQKKYEDLNLDKEQKLDNLRKSLNIHKDVNR